MNHMNRWIAGGAAMLLSTSLWAQAGGATVKVGKDTKITRGTVTKLEAGDVACYVTLKDESGKTVEEKGNFEVCDDAKYKGKKVELSWTLAKLMSPDCQGDTSCTKTITVPLISAMKVAGAGAANTPAKAAAPASSKQTSYCTPSEQVVFACQMGKKLVSVCADPKSTAKTGMLQYRFGNPAEPALELMWPESYLPPSKVASGASFPLSGGGGMWLRIPKGDHAYVVYSATGKFGPGGAVASRAGLTVERKGKPIAQLKCTSKDIGELSPQWMEKMGITDQKQDFELPE